MKKVFGLLLLGLLLPLNCFASDNVTVKITTHKGVYVRSGAGINYSKVGYGLIYGKEVSVSLDKVSGPGCSNGWYKITLGNYKDNYICSNYTQVISNSNNTISNTTTNNVVTEPEVFVEKIVTVTTPLNLRKDATTKSDKIDRLATGKNYVATERIIKENSGCKNNTWYKIQVNEKTGYVCSAYVRDGASTDKYVSSCSGNISDYDANILGVSTNETFVEVDTTNQKLTFYKNGVCQFTSSTVTGKDNIEKEMIETTPGSFRITEKVRNKHFVSSHVYSNYWMRFNLGMGLHDADNWRASYGFKGSHGCVNLPLSAAKAIYDNVEVGTRVIVHK